jgi:hypothetical protein
VAKPNNIRDLELDKFLEDDNGDTAVNVSSANIENKLEEVLSALGVGAVRLDDVGAGVSYVGAAVAGASTASAVWQIKKIVESGNDITVTWADGNTNFDNVWNNRLSLTYL